MPRKTLRLKPENLSWQMGCITVSLKDKRHLCLDCRFRFSDFSGTLLSSNKIPLTKLIFAVKLFGFGLSARQTAHELHLNYKTVLSLFDTIRRALVRHGSQVPRYLGGEVEVDESYFVGKRKGKRGRGSQHKIPVFGMCERNGQVIVRLVPDVSAETLRGLIKRNIQLGARVYSDTFRSYNSLIINGYDHVKINKERGFAHGKIHINSIESFWAFAKEKLVKFHGVKPEKFYLYLKEQEFRFNHRQDKDLVTIILSYLVRFHG